MQVAVARGTCGKLGAPEGQGEARMVFKRGMASSAIPEGLPGTQTHHIVYTHHM